MLFHSLPAPEDVRQQPHYLRSHLHCWCDYDAIGMRKNVSTEQNIVFSYDIAALLSIVLTMGHSVLVVFWAFCPVVDSLPGFVSVGCFLYMDYTSHWSTCGIPQALLILCCDWSSLVSSLTNFPPFYTICTFPNLAEDDGSRFLQKLVIIQV